MVCHHSIDEEMVQRLIPDEARVSRFYVLPKFTNLETLVDQSYHPSCGAPTEGISHFVDFHLGPLVRNIHVPSYIKDTTDFLMKLDAIKNLPTGMILVTHQHSSQ